MTENWLHAYLVASVGRNLCTRIHCTTCGATEFRQGLLRALATATQRPPSRAYTPQVAIDLARALADARFSDAEAAQLEEAGRCVVYDICSAMGEREAEQLLGQGWGGDVLRRMQEHHRRVVEARRAKAEYEAPARVQERREERRRVAQQRHEQRLTLKKERDRTWRESQGKRGG